MKSMRYWQKPIEKSKELSIEVFRVFSITLLSFLLPLSFLFLPRICSSHYFVELSPTKSRQSLFLSSILIHPSQTLLYLIVSSITIITLLQGVFNRSLFFKCESPESICYFVRLYGSWTILYGLLFVFPGLEPEIGSYNVSKDGSPYVKVLFLLGLHETMQAWSQAVAKPVVDDTLFDCCREENRVERLGVALGFGVMWWWKLRDEFEGFVGVAERKMQLLVDIEADDLFSFWLYYMTVLIGLMRALRSCHWILKVLLFCITRKHDSHSATRDSDTVRV